MFMGLANGAGGLGCAAIGCLAAGQGLRGALLVGFAAVVPAALIARRALAERPASNEPHLFVTGSGCAGSGCSCESIVTVANSIDGCQPTVSGSSAPSFKLRCMTTTQASNRQRLVDAWAEERHAAVQAVRRNEPSQAWNHLERAHILSQPMAGRHVRTHLAMLRCAVRMLRPHEVAGQLFRSLVAAPGSWSGRYPVGNTGGADVSAFAPMDIPEDLRSLLETVSDKTAVLSSPTYPTT